MRRQGLAARLTILVDELDSWHHAPVYVEIIRRAHDRGLAGATAVRGMQGFAGTSEIHSLHLLHLGDHVPVVITIVDSHRKLGAFLDDIASILHKGIAVLDDVEVVRYYHEPKRGHRHKPAPRVPG